LQLRIARARITHFRNASTATRAEPGIHDAALVGLDDDMDVFAILLDDVVHGRRIPRSGLSFLLLAQIDAEFILIGRGPALLVRSPGISFVAATNDAIVTGNVELLRVLRDDWEAVNLTFVRHCFLPSENV